MSYSVHCPDCNTVVMDEKGEYTDDWSGYKMRCHDHKLGAGPCASALELRYNTTFMPDPEPIHSRWPTDEEQRKARVIMAQREHAQVQKDRDNRLASAKIAVSLWGVRALEVGMSASDRRLVQAVLDGKA